MSNPNSNPPPSSPTQVAYGLALQALRDDVQKINEVMRAGIVSAEQLEKTDILYCDAYDRLQHFKHDWTKLEVYNPQQVFADEVDDLLVRFNQYSHDVMFDPAFQQQCLADMALLAPLTDAPSVDTVIFGVQMTSFRSPCVELYRPPVICERGSLRVVQTPRWVHTVMAANLTPIPAFMLTADPCTFAFRIGDPLPVPSPDILVHALLLWQDAPKDGVYANFFDALTAVQLLN